MYICSIYSPKQYMDKHNNYSLPCYNKHHDNWFMCVYVDLCIYKLNKNSLAVKSVKPIRSSIVNGYMRLAIGSFKNFIVNMRFYILNTYVANMNIFLMFYFVELMFFEFLFKLMIIFFTK